MTTANILEKLKTNLKDIDAIFETSKNLQTLYLSGLKSLQQNSGLKRTEQITLTNKVTLLENIETESLEEVEQKNWSRLYAQGLVLVVSISEQLLKEVFENILFERMESVKKIEEVNFSFADIKERNFILDREAAYDLLKEKLYSEKNPTERLNFQNIKAIESIFDSYFQVKLNLPDNLIKNLHYSFQCRHIIVHNGSIVDKRFLDNLQIVNVTRNHQEYEKLIVSKDMYDDTKQSYLNFFTILESKL